MENEADVIRVKDFLNGFELEKRVLRADLARRKTVHEKTPGRCKYYCCLLICDIVALDTNIFFFFV